MKIVSTGLEKRAIRTITSSNKRVASTLLALLDESDFSYPPAQEAYRRITAITQKRGKTPEWEDLLTDTAVAEPVRKIFSHYKKKPWKSIGQVRDKSNALHRYRKLRRYFEIAEYIQKTCKNDSVDVDNVGDALSEKIAHARLGGDIFNSFTNIGGDDGKFLKTVRTLLKGKKNRYIPTGFKAFDEVNGGIFRGSCFTIAATTGGGKSTLAQVMAINMARYGARVGMISLEMEQEEMVMRMMANLSGISMQKIIKPELMTDKEKKYIYKKSKSFHKRIKRIESIYSIVSPDEDVSMEDVLLTSKPMAFDVVIVDYINLLKGMDEEQQWRKLGAAARFAKVYARINKCVVVILAQLSDEGNIRYSRAVQEHCLPADTLIDTPNGIIPIGELVNLEKKGEKKTKIAFNTDKGVHSTSHVYNNGKKEVFEITSDSGYTLKATANHPIWVERNGKGQMIRVENLQKTDKLVFHSSDNWPKKMVELSHQTPAGRYTESKGRQYLTDKVNLPKKLTPELARIIGYMLGDGHIKYDASNPQTPRMTFTNKDPEVIRDFINCFKNTFGIKLEAKSQNKGKYYQISCYKQQLVSFLCSFTGISGNAHEKYIPDAIMRSPKKIVGECLGALYDCDGHSHTEDKTLGLTSKEMIRRYALLLQKADIYGVFSERKHKNVNHRTLHFFRVAGVSNLEKWCDFVRCIHKQKCTRHTTAWRKYNRKYNIQGIRSIKSIGKEIVYDVTIPKVHRFIADGFVVSNSNNMWQWIYSQEAREKQIIEVRQTKARNQKPFPFFLKEDFDKMQITDFEGAEEYKKELADKKKMGHNKGPKLDDNKKKKYRRESNADESDYHSDV